MSDEYSEWDAAYVLGMLSAEERRTFERHLAGCPACTAAVGELAGLPGILNRLGAADAEALLGDDARSAADSRLTELAGAPSSVQHLATAVRRRRARGRRRIAALVAGAGVLVAAAGLVVGLGLGPIGLVGGTPAGPSTEAGGPVPTASADPGAGSGDIVRAMAQVQPGWIDADLTVSAKGWGTRFDWNCSYRGDWADTGEPVSYDLVVTDREGIETSVASWTTSGGAAGNLSASTGIATADIRVVDIRLSGSDAPIVRTVL